MVRLHSVPLGEQASCIGKCVKDLALEDTGAEISAIRRGKVRLEAEAGTTLEAGDVVVLRGTAEEVARAENDLLA
jgi:CPA2 family monovalent cation:H+ antiporter-2